jgi:hypothetical protein
VSELTLNQEIDNLKDFQIPGTPVGDVYEDYAPPRESQLKKILSAPTGSGSIEEYVDHPLNFNSSKGIAKVIRGLTGILGNLNLAVVDIVLGGLEVSADVKKSPKRMNGAGTEEY